VLIDEKVEARDLVFEVIEGKVESTAKGLKNS